MRPGLDIEGLPDEKSRRRIREELDANFLVEAGAGSGKTSELINRMLALVCSGRAVEHIAAVTFTRKAAGELARRFREALETLSLRARREGDPRASRLDAALESVDRAFIGTIHAFCSRLLREHAVEAGIDPGFVELSEDEARRLRAEFWVRQLDRLHVEGDAALREVVEAGIELEELQDAFRELVEDVDVRYEAERTEIPEFEDARRQLEELLDRAMGLLQARTFAGRPDGLERAVRQLHFLRDTRDWTEARSFFEALDVLDRSGRDVTLVRWAAKGPEQAPIRALKRDVLEFLDGGEGARALDAWRVHRYALVLDFLKPMVAAFAEERRRAGRLTFTDLLERTAELLGRDDATRRDVGERYRYLLVDEFQDTDPLQAAICFLLASDPAEGRDWRLVRPRPGALFVVGDPKQSIYRFRRADIQVYGIVRERIAAMGDVLSLTCNFRSRGAIGAFVDVAFASLFDRSDDEGQAEFAPMNTRPDQAGGRVARTEISLDTAHARVNECASRDAARVATWISDRKAEGRSYGDFLVLTYRKNTLQAYARAFERRGIPVLVTGMGLVAERELRELLDLLRALVDPGNPVTTVAALQGLFFGLDPERLWLHREQGRSFSFDRREFQGDSDVERALETLHRWAAYCAELPVDAAVDRIVSESGLLPLAASSEMGDARAGSLVHVSEVIAAAALGGATDLQSGIEAVEAVLESPDVEAKLQPGRPDAVRLMNVHKAKGLEAPVVVLACPAGKPTVRPTKHVSRVAGEPVGWLHVKAGEDDDERGARTIAWPQGWAEHEAREEAFERAEARRVLYVAATRAGEELIVAERPQASPKSPWGELAPFLSEHAELIEMVETPASERPQPSATLADVERRIGELHERRRQAAEPAFGVATVTGSLKEEGELRGEGRGREWGTIVHRAIAAMGRGRTGDELRRHGRALLLEGQRPRDTRGEPAELAELMGVLDRLRGSRAWRDVTAGETRWELAVMQLQPDPAGGAPTLVSGTIDAAATALPDGSWRFVDWKTDAVQGAEWASRETHYRLQVEAYRDILRALTGREAAGTVERVR